MAAILGISAHYHDAAAALVVDGAVVAADAGGAASRGSRTTRRCRSHAARACLAHAGLAAGDLDRVVFYENPVEKLERVLVSTLRTFPRSLRQFPRAIGAQLGSKIWVLDRIAEQLGVARASGDLRPSTTARTPRARSSSARTRARRSSPSTASARRPRPRCGTATARQLHELGAHRVPALARPALRRRSPRTSASRSTRASTR